MSQTRETDGLSTATKPKAHIIKSDSRSADAFGQVDLTVNNAGIPKVAPAADCAMAMLAFAAGLLVTTLAARAADEPARPRPTVEQGGTDSVRVQPTEKSFAPPNQPDVSASDASDIDKRYRQLIGTPPATAKTCVCRKLGFRRRRSAGQKATPQGVFRRRSRLVLAYPEAGGLYERV